MGRGRGRGGRGGRDPTLISQTVRISMGPYKGECKHASVLSSLKLQCISKILLNSDSTVALYLNWAT